MLIRTLKAWHSRIMGVGILLYPLIVQFAVVFDKRTYAVAYLLLLVTAYLLSMRIRTIWLFRFVIVLLFFAGLISINKYEAAQFWLYVPPVLIPLLLSFVFIRSLFQPEGPLISRIAMLVEGETLDDKQLRYTRMVTMIWAGMLLLLAIETIVLAWFAPFSIWSWWAHVGNYLILFALFVLEIIARRILIQRGPKLNRMIKVMLTRPWQTRSSQ